MPFASASLRAASSFAHAFIRACVLASSLQTLYWSDVSATHGKELRVTRKTIFRHFVTLTLHVMDYAEVELLAFTSAIGSVNENVEPFPTSVLTDTSPPCASTMLFTMFSPSPRPCSRERASFTSPTW
jgi:hypothetical protein